MSYAILAAKRYGELRFEEQDRNALMKAKECLIDFISCVYAGLPYESSNIVCGFALETYARGKCSVFGIKEKLVPAGACMVNSATAHAPELDDTSTIGGGHVGAIVIPVALALGEELGLSGKEILLSMICGYDMQIRVGQSCNQEALFAKGFHPTALCGMFGATITAAKMLNLNMEQMANALGIIGSFVSGNLECYSDGSFTKRLQPGISSSSGVMSAALAKKGFTGPKSIFEGPRGFFNLYCENSKGEEINREDELKIKRMSFKPYACCRLSQAPIDAILAIRAQEGIGYKDISSILIELSKTAFNIVGQPAEKKYNPQNVVDAQFSAPYGVAIACIEGKAFLKEFSEEAILRMDVREFMRKITIKHSDDLDKYIPDRPARMTVTLNSGKSVTKEVMHAKGDPKNPLSWEELVAKYDALVPEKLINKASKMQIVDSIKNLEQIRDIREFMELICAERN